MGSIYLFKMEDNINLYVDEFDPKKDQNVRVVVSLEGELFCQPEQLVIAMKLDQDCN